jgi:deoxyribonuclease-4
MEIKFGPSGLGSVKTAEKVLEQYSELGLKVCEIAFTYGAYIKNKQNAEKIKKKAKELGIELTIHAPYWINLNSAEKIKIEKSKKRILRSLEVGTWLGAKKVVFHPGYYGKKNKKETYENIKKEIKEILEKAKENKFKPMLCPETTGKINVFGNIDEIAKLNQETGCSFCIDFAHILARYKSYNFKEVFEKIIKKSKKKEVHIHFSGIIYGDKGEKKHKITEKKELEELLKEFKKYKRELEEKHITIISESPNPVKDSIKAIEVWNKIE